ncbi:MULTISPECIES: hypothetical protein [unclassified Halomonas]|uniref:hypothetical protein n=1 Tax=unclassified Halomonas TaxID=2609666 RepID=UPI0024685BF7|nr:MULTISPECIES: hypothetical protein [unclassified Halomonas]
MRFIEHVNHEINERCFTPLIERLILWINQGKTSYRMVHTPDVRGALKLAYRLSSRLCEHCLLSPLEAFEGERQARLF